MAKEHHCPNCGAQPCNASTSKIHTCGVCAAVWEEVLSEAPPAPKPAATPPSAPAAAQAKLASPAGPPVKPPASGPPVPAPPATPSEPPAAASPPAAARPMAPSAAATAARDEDRPPPRRKPLSDVAAAAKVKRCPACESDNLAAPSDYLEQGGRIILVDSQTYRAHRWYADTGELLKPEPLPPLAPAPPNAAKPSA